MSRSRVWRVPLYPNTPVGLNLIAGEETVGEETDNNRTAIENRKSKIENREVAEDMRRVAQVCAPNKVPLDSLAWRLADTPALSAQQVERIRRALSAFPTLKNVLLLPTLHATAMANPAPAESVFSSAAASASLLPTPLPFAPPVAFVARLLEMVSSSLPNALVGGLLEEPLPPLPGQIAKAGDASNSLRRDMGLNENAQSGSELAQGALALLNRMAGTRLKAQSDDGGIGCLSSRSQTRTYVLLWREPAANPAPARPSRLRATDNALVVVRLHHPALENSNGLRVTQTDMAQASAATLHPVLASMPTLNSPSGSDKTDVAETVSLPPPSGVSDTFWSSKGEAAVPPGDVEMPALLEPGSVCLLEIVPLNAKNPIAVTMALDTGKDGSGIDLRGGDPLNVILSVRNLSPRPQALDITLDSPFRDLLPSGATRFKPGVLPVNGGRTFQFAIHAPVLGANANMTLNARVCDNAVSLTLPVQTPLQAALEFAPNGCGKRHGTGQCPRPA